MRIVSRGMATIIAALSVAGSASAAPVETVLYTFAGGSDGHVPFAGLVADEQQWALYGTTNAGGVGNNGTVFKLTPPPKGQTAWKETVIYRFCSLSNCSDGATPRGGLITDKQGALYGTTSVGGKRLRSISWLWDGFQADAAPQGPDCLERDRPLQFCWRQRRRYPLRWSGRRRAAVGALRHNGGRWYWQ